MQKKAKKTFNDLMEGAQIPADKTAEPLHAYDMDEYLDLANPYSRIACFILYLYSLEFGDPPLYAEVNKAARTNDQSKVETLGPFQRALISITSQAEKARDPSDRIKNGQYIFENEGGVEKNLGGIFLLFRGMQMKDEWIKNYESKTKPPKCVRLPGSVSCSRDIHVALHFATQNLQEDKIPVVFVISNKNYVQPNGMRMNNEAYTSYPSEGEVLLQEGIPAFIIDVKRDILIDNPYTNWKMFNGLKVSFIFLYF